MTTFMTRCTVITICAGALFVAGCGSDEPSPTDTPTAPVAIMIDNEYSDKRFIDMMAPHHQMGIDMAEEALENSKDANVRDLSERIVRAQMNEIEELARVRQRLYDSRTSPKKMHPDSMQNMGMGVHGSASQPSEHGEHHAVAAASSSDEFDRQFLDDMLAHHAAAVQHASIALIHSKDDRLKLIAREIVDKQSVEIGQMIGWRLERWDHVY